MNKLPKISIPNPCTENWAAMMPDEKGRYCTACQTSVQDFTSLSDSELISFFQQKQIPACGRFAQRQLEILNSQDKPNTNIVTRISKYAAAALIGAAILPQSSTAQETIIQDKQSEIKHEFAQDISDTLIVTGTVSDENGNPVIGCEVRLNLGIFTTFTDENGAYKIDIPRELYENGSNELVFEYFGLESKVAEAVLGKELNVQLEKSTFVKVQSTAVDLKGITISGMICNEPTFWQRITRPFKRLF